MKLLTILLFFSLWACDAPQRTRFQTNPGVGEDLSDSFFNSSGEPGSGISDEEDSDEDDGTDDDDTAATTPGFENCSLVYQYYGGSQIGHFGLCQSTLNESTFKLKMANTDKTVGTCFVPIHRLANGNSFKLGIAECVHNESGKVYDMILTKDRPEEINGVMVIKYDKAPTSYPLTSYMNCMNAKNNYILANPNCINSAQCLMDAERHAQYLCTQFKNQYSAFYVQVSP
ncbi:MAG: hypothetical protein CME62_04555 [Halobacteriovoraceae bacterium]|nr:hypothetical protein [Halobacteriovoraceae bacterium]|tara:strand:- start:9295 stop:9981 length:687 start_codon:yes stop_codon:yes gene_type:complete